MSSTHFFAEATLLHAMDRMTIHNLNTPSANTSYTQPLFVDTLGTTSRPDPSVPQSPSPMSTFNTRDFDSPYFSYKGNGTPSLIEETAPTMTSSSSSFAHASMQFILEPSVEGTPLVGLGLSGVYNLDGSAFSGSGILPRQAHHVRQHHCVEENDKHWTECAPEQEEDAWISRDNFRGGEQLRNILDFESAHPPLMLLPCAVHASTSPLSSVVPIEPEADDVFFSRKPLPRQAYSRRRTISHQVVSSWFQRIESPAMDVDGF